MIKYDHRPQTRQREKIFGYFNPFNRGLTNNLTRNKRSNDLRLRTMNPPTVICKPQRHKYYLLEDKIKTISIPWTTWDNLSLKRPKRVLNTRHSAYNLTFLIHWIEGSKQLRIANRGTLGPHSAIRRELFMTRVVNSGRLGTNASIGEWKTMKTQVPAGHMTSLGAREK